MSTDAIVLLKEDHKEIKKTFDAFEKAGENAFCEKGCLVEGMIEVLTVPTYIENEVIPVCPSVSRKPSNRVDRLPVETRFSRSDPVSRRRPR